MMTNSICNLVDQIRPGLPADFDKLTQGEQQFAVDGQKNLIQMRRNLVELIAGQRIQHGEIQQYEADAKALTQQLVEDRAKPEDKRLPDHRTQHVNGRRLVAVAQAERGRELIEQYGREIDLYRQILEAS